MTTIEEEEHEDLFDMPPPPVPQVTTFSHSDDLNLTSSLVDSLADAQDPFGLTSDDFLLLSCPLHPGVSDCLCQNGFVEQWDLSAAPNEALIEDVDEPDYNQIQNVCSSSIELTVPPIPRSWLSRGSNIHSNLVDPTSSLARATM
jgi:hypothetical protein